MGCGVSSTYTNDSTLTTSTTTNTAKMKSKNASNNVGQDTIDKRNVLQTFNNLESAIQTMEETKCFEKYRIMSDDIEQLKEQLQHLKDDSKLISSRIAHESNQLLTSQSLRNIVTDNIINNSTNDTSTIELLNNQKIVEMRIDLVSKDIENLNVEIKELQMICDQLQELYQQRDNLLNQVFEGNYGNEKEIQLEKELDTIMEERHYIEIAKMRWINSDNLIIDALKCLDNTTDKIQQFNEAIDNDLDYKYNCVKEARNSLVLTHYNLMSLHNVLQNVKLPHCTMEDLESLEKQTSVIFNHITSPKELAQLLEFIESLRSKTVTQHKWVKEVLNKTIKTDLVDIRDKYRSKSYELRLERTMLIKQKQEVWLQQDDNFKNDSPFDLRVDSGVDSELDESVIAEEQLARILASGKDSITSPDLTNSTPLLPGEELAPIPTNKEIFGKIVQLRNKHIREMQEFEQNQRLTKVRMTQGLRDKLNARRSRRSRIEMHRRQLEALQESPMS